METVKKLFTGRIGRGKFFLFELLIVAGGIIVWLTIQVLPPILDIFLLTIFILTGFVLSLGLCVKRIHDIGQSAWWLGLLFIPIIDTGMAIYLLVRKGQNGTNLYGDQP